MKTHRKISFQVPVLFLAAAMFAAGPAKAQDASPLAGKLEAPVKPAVSGKFIGDGKPAAIQFVVVEEHEEFDGKPALTLIFTEKDPAKVRKPSFDASFGKLGSALVLSVFYDGQIFGCEVSHSAHRKSGFSSVGEIKMGEFKVAGGKVTGHVSTGGTLDAFGQKWEVDLTFAAPLPEKLRTATAAPTKPGNGSEAPSAPREKPAKRVKSAANPGASAVAARSLPLPKDATDVQYKAVVHQIHLASAQPVAAVVAELSEGLKAQGWKDGAGGVKGPKNAILKRELDGAKLTIMIQTAGTGSTVKIFADGLNWDSAGATEPPIAGSPAAEIDAAKKDAQKAIHDAFKDLPKDLLK